ncbi:MAG TPA: C45 family peptidase [Methylomirabilota bacterium]|nr:C45 family peptidase [Methylomirabilota bacterium]
MIARFPHHRLHGTPREVGHQHGETLRAEIRAHLDLIYTQGSRRSNLTPETARRWALAFGPVIGETAPHFLEEIEGVAAGADIEPAEALLLQVRQEVAHIARFGSPDLECTSFAVSGDYTRTGGTLAGQNADLAGGIEEFSAVVTFAVTGKPTVMMLVPAGQISYLGISGEGLSANANFLRSAGWRTGLPRYLLTRLAIEQPTLKAGVDAALTPKRASSRNLLLADRSGAMVDIETTAQEHALTWGNGCLVHANHHVLPGMAAHETATPDELHNSTCRHERIAALMEANRGRLDGEALETILRDHANRPHSICAHPGERVSYSFASLISDLDAGSMAIAVGPPCQHEYATYSLEDRP